MADPIPLRPWMTSGPTGPAASGPPPPPLPPGGGGGTSGGMNEIIDAKIAASEARTDANFARLVGKLDLLAADLSGKIGGVLAAVSETRVQAASDKAQAAADKSEIKAQAADEKSSLAAHIAATNADIKILLNQQKTDITNNRNSVVTTVFGVGVAIVAILIAVMGYGDSVFSRGMSVRDLVHAVQSEKAAPAKP